MAELGNVQVSLAWAVATEDMAAAYDMVMGLIFVADLLGGYRYAIRTLDAALAPVEPPDSDRRPDQQPSATAVFIPLSGALAAGRLLSVPGAAGTRGSLLRAEPGRSAADCAQANTSAICRR